MEAQSDTERERERERVRRIESDTERLDVMEQRALKKCKQLFVY